MTVISISIDEAAEQLVAGIPRTVNITTNIPATIFYTLDGSTPTISSSIFILPITLPTEDLTVILKIFATNGIDNSPIITKTYSTNILNDVRLPHSPTTPLNVKDITSLFPFGDNSPNPNFNYLNPAQAGTTVNNPSLPVIPFGYDANGNPIGANQQFDDYLNVYSTTDYQNKTPPGVGNLPAQTTIIGDRLPKEYQPEESSRSSKVFNPKAKVIFQDASTEDPTNPAMLNRQYFSMENEEIVKDGAALYALDLETQTTTGSFIRSFYNSRTQMTTYYYRDAATNRWIISTQPYQQTNPQNDGNLSFMVSPKGGSGARYLHPWFPFARRVLF